MNEKYKTTTPLFSGGWGKTEGNKQYAISNLQIKCGFAEGK